MNVHIIIYIHTLKYRHMHAHAYTFQLNTVFFPPELHLLSSTIFRINLFLDIDRATFLHCLQTSYLYIQIKQDMYWSIEKLRHCVTETNPFSLQNYIFSKPFLQLDALMQLSCSQQNVIKTDMQHSVPYSCMILDDLWCDRAC